MSVKKLSWFRFYGEARTDMKISRVCVLSKQPKGLVMGAWTILLCLASDSPERGQLLISEDMPVTIEEIIFEIGIDDEAGKALINAFIKVDMLTLEGDIYGISKWNDRQYSSDSSTNRVRRFRKRQRQEKPETRNRNVPGGEGDDYPKRSRNDDETFRNVPVTPPESESESETNSINNIAPAHGEHDTREAIDPLGHLFELQETHNPQAAEPGDYEKYFGSRDEFINIFVQKTGDYPGEVVKGEIVRLGSRPDACPKRWAKSIDQAIMNYSGHGKPPPIRYVHIYEQEGSYEKYKAWMVSRGNWTDFNKNGGNEKNGDGKLSKTAQQNQKINRAANTALDPTTGKTVLLS